MELTSFIEKDKAEEVINAINNGTDIMVTGGVGSGKTQLCKTLSKIAAGSEYEYNIVDEAYTESSINFIEDVICRKNNKNEPCRIIFSYHTKDESVIRRTFPNFKGLVLNLEADCHIKVPYLTYID